MINNLIISSVKSKTILIITILMHSLDFLLFIDTDTILLNSHLVTRCENLSFT